jgi:2'-5' RNA ligase
MRGITDGMDHQLGFEYFPSVGAIRFQVALENLESSRRMIRVFIAIDLSDSIRNSIRDHVDRMAQSLPKGAIRWVRVEGIHLTLKFLGNISHDKISSVQSVMENVTANVERFKFQVSELGCFPRVTRPRVLWIGVQEPSGALGRVQSVLAQGLEGLGFERELRAFHPHLTIGRVKRHVRSTDIKLISQVIQQEKIGLLGEVEVHQVLLIRSDLQPSGAVYTHLTSAELKGD